MNWLGEALNIIRSINDQKNEAVINLEMGLTYENLGEYTLSKNKYYQPYLLGKVENPVWLSNLLNNLGVLEQMMGNYEEAIQSFDRSLDYARSCNYIRMEAYVLTGIADLYAELQADEQSLKIYQMAAEIAERARGTFLTGIYKCPVRRSKRLRLAILLQVTNTSSKHKNWSHRRDQKWSFTYAN